jgi:hypothetical protein
MAGGVTIREVRTRADRKAFVSLPATLYAADPHWIAPLRAEVHELLNPAKNPWFEHATAAFFLAVRDGRVVGRISAQVDRLVSAMPPEQGGGGDVGIGACSRRPTPMRPPLCSKRPRTGSLRDVKRAMGPFSLSVWDEPGLLVWGHDHSPTVMMGHHLPAYAGWIEAAAMRASRTSTPTISTSVSRCRRSPSASSRPASATADHPAQGRQEEVRRGSGDHPRHPQRCLVRQLGLCAAHRREIRYAGKKLRPIVFEDLIMIAEVDGEPVAFMMTLPDLNEMTRDLNGSLFPFGFLKLLWRLRRPRVRNVRVPLMGVVKRLQATRLASQLAFMMIETIRRAAVANYGAVRGEIGWILDDNQGMRSIADAIGTKHNKTYRIYERAI